MSFDEELYNMTIEYWRSDECKEYRIKTINSPSHYFGGTNLEEDTDLKVNSRSKRFVKLLSQYFTERDYLAVHELGCNVGRNLFFVRSFFENSIVSGNDVNKEAIELGRKEYFLHDGRANLFVGDTFDVVLDFLNKNKVFDVLFTMAHFIHIPRDVMIEIAPFVKKICKMLICFESSGIRTDKYSKSLLFRHDYAKLFGEPIQFQDFPCVGIRNLFVWRYDV